MNYNMKIGWLQNVRTERKAVWREHLPNIETDEATISRAFFHRIDGGLQKRIERKQEMKDGTTISSRDGRNKYLGKPVSLESKEGEVETEDESPRLWNTSPLYHLFNYLALKLAGTVFPENFVRVRSLRVIEEEGKLFSVISSDYVGDTSGVIERRNLSKGEFYAAYFGGKRQAAYDLRDAADSEERMRTPGLVQAIAKVQAAGIILEHPEANYHVDEKGNVVFFEVKKIDVDGIVGAINRMPEGKQKDLANIYLAGVYMLFVEAEFETIKRIGGARGACVEMGLFGETSFNRLVKMLSLQFRKGNYELLEKNIYEYVIFELQHELEKENRGLNIKK
ncbi:Uncharacterised protein [Candidatus Gugararchaeum adminiculabundum]|nr:Uncharacterised protein [Candidatus Gugararchaeum adminiculabundum]